MSRSLRRAQGKLLAEFLGHMDEGLQALLMRLLDSLVHNVPLVLAFDGNRVSVSFGDGPGAAALAIRYRQQLVRELDALGVPEINLSGESDPPPPGATVQ